MTSSRKSRKANAGEGLLVGRLVGPFGIRGEVKLMPETDHPEHLLTFKQFRLRRPDGGEEEREVERTRPHKGMILVKFRGVDTMTDAEALRDCGVWIEDEEAVPLKEGEYFVHDLIGLRVVTPDGEELGVVSDVLRSAANDVYVAGKYMIPAIDDAIVEIAPERGVIVVRSRAYLEGEEIR